MPQIRCIHHDLFQKDGYVCYCFNGSRTHNSLLLVCHRGNWWELRDTAERQFPVQAAGVLEASAHTRGTIERFGGKGAKYLGSFGNITLAGTVNTHASCLVHMAQQIRHTVSSAGVCFSAPTCLCGPGTEGPLGPLERSAVSARDIISVKRWRVSTQATDAPAPNASYIQPSVPFNKSLDKCVFVTRCRDQHVTSSYYREPSSLKDAMARFGKVWPLSVSGTAVRSRAHNGINAGARATRETLAVNGRWRQ